MALEVAKASNDDSMSPSEYAGAMLFRHAEAKIDYESGGVTFVPADLNMNRFQNVIIEVDDGSSEEVRWDDANDALMLYDSDGTESDAGTTVGVHITGIGR